MTSVLQLDINGTPQAWISFAKASKFFAEDNVAWSLGDTVVTLRGGRCRHTGTASSVDIPSIIATKGSARINLLNITPSLTRHNHKLFARDRHLCAYCGHTFDAAWLTREHIVPKSKGGKNVWMNVVTACRSCNSRKANRTPEEAKMPLLYLPYVPNRYEDFFLQRGGKQVLADQMEFLLHRVPQHSRLRLS